MYPCRDTRHDSACKHSLKIYRKPNKCQERAQTYLFWCYQSSVKANLRLAKQDKPRQYISCQASWDSKHRWIHDIIQTITSVHDFMRSIQVYITHLSWVSRRRSHGFPFFWYWALLNEQFSHLKRAQNAKRSTSTLASCSQWIINVIVYQAG